MIINQGVFRAFERQRKLKIGTTVISSWQQQEMLLHLQI
ncbi:unnamed protein product [Paramecium octaurelia]|uniref:Uncharacterized protein n=1 Tax=Paramecium octaurelia TaxID=43137 RepID=A0A8S1WYG1_PAROT|nr:unnamed protein product [Paramecium octaurelia]